MSGPVAAAGSRKRLADAQRSALHALRWVPDAVTTEVPHTRPHDGAADTWLLVGDDRRGDGPLARAFAEAGWKVVSVRSSEVEATLRARRDSVRGVVLCGPRCANDGGFAPIAVLQSVLRALGPDVDDRGDAGRPLPALWLVTRGAQTTGGSPAAVDVDQAAMWGAARCLLEEHPSLWAGLVDLEPDRHVGDAAGASSDAGSIDAGSIAGSIDAGSIGPSERCFVAQATSASRSGQQLVVRAGRIHRLRLQAAPDAAAAGRLAWRSDGAVLLTGAFGAIGRLIALALADQGVRRLVLLGRTSLPARTEWAGIEPESPIGRRIDLVKVLEAKGLAVHSIEADLGDERSIAAAVERYRAEGWPAIRGLVHGAGVTEDGLASRTDRQSFARVFDVKAMAALELERCLPDLENVILFSSIMTFLAPAGTASYAAANAALDAIAINRRARGQHGLAIQWGAWRETGLVARPGASRSMEAFQAQGIESFEPDDGVRIYHAVHGTADHGVTVMPVVPERLHRLGVDWRVDLFAGRLPQGADREAREATAVADGAATPEARRQRLRADITAIIASILHLPGSRIDPRRTLGSLGLNSLMSMELRNRLERLSGRVLSATVAWNHPTVEALVALLAPPQPVAAPSLALIQPPRGVAPADEDPDDLDEVSDADAIAMLRSRRRA